MKKLALRRFKSAGDLVNERVVLEATADTNLGNYMVCRSVREDLEMTPAVSSIIEDPIWFPDKEVKKGDYILVFTCKGEDRSFRNKSGTSTHVFHLNKNQAMWTESDRAAIAFEVGGWDFITVRDEVSEEEAED